MGLDIAIAAGLGLGITMLLAGLALRFDWGRILPGRAADWHHAAGARIPRWGGAILALSFICIEICIAWLRPDLRAATPGRNVIVAGSLAMFALGFWDDLRPLGAGWKLLGQVLIAGTVCLCGVGLEIGTMPFVASPIHLGAWGPVLTILWLVSLTNLINLIDGVDGLAGGICVMLMGLVAAVAHQSGNFELLACGMAGALLGFLCYNFPPARIYLGDGGAYFLGFQIGLYSVVNSHRGTVFTALVAPLFVLALPVSDAGLTLARRGLRGLPLFRPDRKHLHHRLMAWAGSSRKVVLLVYGLSLLFLLMGLLAFWSHGESLPVLAGAAVLVLLACAGTFGFSRQWFALHRVVRGSLGMRGQVRYALSLAHWLELEGRRQPSGEQLWSDLVFAADKLGFASLQLTCPDKHRVWRSAAGRMGTARCRYDCRDSRPGNLEFTAPLCPAEPLRQAQAGRCDNCCRQPCGGCLANPRVFETVSELLAEAWNRSMAEVHARQGARPVQARVHPSTARSTNNGVLQIMKKLVTAWFAFCLMVSFSPAETLTPQQIEAGLRTVPPPELPLKTAELIRQAEVPHRADAVTNVVPVALALNPAATPLIVGAVVSRFPENAAVAVSAAAREQPAQVEEITRAALGSAAVRAGDIVAAACAIVPGEYKRIAVAAARIRPQETREILRAVARVRSELHPYLNEEIARSGQTPPSVSTCLSRAELASRQERPPPTRGNLDGQSLGREDERASAKSAGPKPPRGNGHQPGGRNYARP